MMKLFLPITKGMEIVVNIKRNNLMYTWSHSINGILRKKRKQTITLFPTEPMQSGLHWTEKTAMAKIMATWMNTIVLNKTVEPMHSHR